MTFTVKFNRPEIKTAFEWQLAQEINVLNANGDVIAKAEIEIVTLNKHRDAAASLEMLAQHDTTDWELPFHIYFSKQNLNADLCKKLDVKPSTKAQQHILLEAISVKPEYRKQGAARFLLEQVASHYPKVQSINTFSMPMALFVDAENCLTPESTEYYQSLNIEEDGITADNLNQFFSKTGFIEIQLDQSELEEPLPFNIFIASVNSVLAGAGNNSTCAS